MTRVKRGVAAHKKHKKLLQMAEGHKGTRRRLYRPAHESVMRSMAYMYRDRRNRNPRCVCLCGWNHSSPARAFHRSDAGIER